MRRLKKLKRSLTEADECRLQDIRNVIEEIDRLTLIDDIRMQRLDRIVFKATEKTMKAPEEV